MTNEDNTTLGGAVEIEGGPVTINPNELVEAFTNRLGKFEEAVVEVAPHVWDITVAKYQMEAVSSLTLPIFFALLTTLLATRFRKKDFVVDTGRRQYGEPVMEPTPRMFTSIAAAITLLVTIITTCNFVNDDLTKLGVPEYYAMHDLAAMAGLK